ncbi:MAG: hypothetical protein GTO12_01195 [Proteobacteria bacterium]|nr:hypothetical protein [Pseudomonadota bacterium]
MGEEVGGFAVWVIGMCSILEEIAVFKDLFDLVDFEIEYVLGGLKRGTQQSQKLVYVKSFLGDNVEFDSIKAFSV